MFRIALFVAGCVVGYIASGYLDGLLQDTEERPESPTPKSAEATS